MMSAFLNELRGAIGPDSVRTDRDTTSLYARDWTQAPDAHALAVAFPTSADEVARIVSLCRTHRVAIVPSGGRTGLAGGAVARGELVVSVERLDVLGPIDHAGQTIRVGAGVINQKLQEHCATHDLMWPIELASKGTSQIGGNLATNAGGVRVIQYGHARRWVLGLRAVMGTGEVLELDRALEKNNTGYELVQLLVGSEGTLGIITDATLKLAPIPRATRVFLFALCDWRALDPAIVHIRQSGLDLIALEVFSEACVMAVSEHTRRPPPLGPAPAYLLIEVAEPKVTLIEALSETLVTSGLTLDGVVSESAAQGRALWSWRENITESLRPRGFVHKNDVAVPVAALGQLVLGLEPLLAGVSLGAYLFGHAGDGNLHVNLIGTGDEQAFQVRARAFELQLYALVKSLGGSISAEHGVGLLKKEDLHFTRSTLELRLFRQLKAVFDPDGILNPGKIFD